MANDIHHTDPLQELNDKGEPVNYVYNWIKNGQKVTMLLTQHWTTPKQGYLSHDENTDEWYFIKSRKLTGERFHLENFNQNCESMIKNKKCFKAGELRHQLSMLGCAVHYQMSSHTQSPPNMFLLKT